MCQRAGVPLRPFLTVATTHKAQTSGDAASVLQCGKCSPPSRSLRADLDGRSTLLVMGTPRNNYRDPAWRRFSQLVACVDETTAG